MNGDLFVMVHQIHSLKCVVTVFPNFFIVNVIKQMQKTNDQRNFHIKWGSRDKNNNSCFTKQEKNNSLYNTKVP